uniref:PX domain-containing protein n=1 Tax=Globisporangium ultimum (strain ATCC 200006 / CBS 805.95 / DAOM BR144) TaxID=431595 RepID=K3WQ72_GLOUD
MPSAVTTTENNDVMLWRRHSYDATTTNDRTYWSDRKPPMEHRASAPVLQRFSLPSSASLESSVRPSSVVSDVEAARLTTTAVRFLGVSAAINTPSSATQTKKRSTKHTHCVFVVQVDTGAEQFVIQKRFSQFRALRQQLFALLEANSHCGNGACRQLAQLTQLKFPRRTLQVFGKKSADLAVARERLIVLQRFVDAMLRVYRMAPKRQLRCCANTNCIALDTIRAFLEIVNPENPLAMSNGSTASTATNDSDFKMSEERSFSSSSTSELNSSGVNNKRRGFPPPTRVTLQSPHEAAHQFEQLYPITEDTELVHMHA